MLSCCAEGLDPGLLRNMSIIREHRASSDTRPGAWGGIRFRVSPPRPMHLRRRVIMAMTSIALGSTSIPRTSMSLCRIGPCPRQSMHLDHCAPFSDSVCFHLWPHGYASPTATSRSLRNWVTGSVSEGAWSGGGGGEVGWRLEGGRSRGGWGSRSGLGSRAREATPGRGLGNAGGGGGGGVRTTH